MKNTRIYSFKINSLRTYMMLTASPQNDCRGHEVDTLYNYQLP